MEKQSSDTGNRLETTSKVQATIDSLIEKHEKLKKVSESTEKAKQTWEMRLSKLIDSNYQGKMELTRLHKETTSLEKRMKLKTEVIENEFQKVAGFKDQNSKRRREKLEDFAFETMNVAREFQNAQINYQSENLTRDIEQYRQELKMINKELESLYRELESLRIKYGFDELNANSSTSKSFDDLRTLRDILLDDSFLLRAIKFAEQTCLQFKNAIQQIKQLMSKKNKYTN